MYIPFYKIRFCLCIFSNSRYAEISREMADSNYPLLPTGATDCSNLHANGHVYYTKGIAKHKVSLINDWLCFCYQKNEIQTLQSCNSAVINTQTVNSTYRYTYSMINR